MLKVLRKYNKMILVVGGTLLLISFLIPQAIQQIGQAQMGRSIGTMDGRKVSLASLDQAQREVAGLREFFRHMDRDLPLGLEEGREAEHWMLLTREAEQAGMVGGVNEGATLVPILAQQIAYNEFSRQYGQFAEYVLQQQPDMVQQMIARMQQIMSEARVRAAGASQLSLDGFDLAMARLRGIDRMLRNYRTAERISDRQAAAIATGLAGSILLDAAFLSARRLADETLQPTAEEIEAHFERFRTVKPLEGEYGVGYYLPARVKLEWIELNRPAIEAAIKIPLPEQTKHHLLNRDRFPGPFADEREKIETELRRAKTDEVLNAADAFVRAEIARAVRPLEKEGDYRVLPAGWETMRPDLVRIADQVVGAIAESAGVTIPTPAVYVRDNAWLDSTRLSALPGIGSATVRFGQQSFPFAQVALSVRELIGETMLALQVGVPAHDLPAIGRDGSKYFYTILSVATEEAPGSIDEVLDRDALIADWRALRRYEELASSAAEFEGRVAEVGLQAFADSFGTVEPEEPPVGAEGQLEDAVAPEVEEEPAPEGAADPAEGEQPSDAPAGEGVADDQAPDEPADTPADPPAEPKVNVLKNCAVYEKGTNGLLDAENSPEVIKAVRDEAEDIDPKSPIDSVPLAERVVAVPLPSRLGVLVGQVNGVQPLTWESLPIHADYATRERWNETFRGVGLPFPFRFEALKERHAFSLRRQSDEEPGEGAPADEQTEAAETQG